MAGWRSRAIPISEEMQEKSDTDGKIYTVQYFERAVFEYHPENRRAVQRAAISAGQLPLQAEVPRRRPRPAAQHLARLGALSPRPAHRWAASSSTTGTRTAGWPSRATRSPTSSWRRATSTARSTRVQYFERAVFEYHPENQPPYDVLLSQLGKFRYDEVAQALAPDANGIQVIGMSSGPQHYPLLSGPHAAPGLNVWIYQNDPQPVVDWLNDLGVKYALHQLSWCDIEPQKGVYKWEILDNAVNALSKAGVRVVLNPVHAPGLASGAGRWDDRHW